MSRIYPQGVPRSIEYPLIPLYSFLENSARKFPNRIGAYYLGRSLTYGFLWKETKKFANYLKSRGVEKGDRVALFLPNVPQFVITFYGTLFAGATVVPLNPLNTAEELARELDETDCHIVIALDRLIDRLPDIDPKTLVVTKATEYAPFHLKIIGSIKKIRLKSSDVWPVQEKSKLNVFQKDLINISPSEDLASILYTSGTTGLPKGVMLTHYNLVTNALQSYFWLRGWGYCLKPQPAGWPVILCAVPFFHSYGLNIMNEAISFGCTLALVPDPKPQAILKTVQNHRVTHMPMIPRFAKELLDYPHLSEYNVSSVTAASSGGAAIEVNVMKKFEELTGARFYQGYGLTEASPATHASPFEGIINYLSAGLAYPDTEAKIVDLQVGEVEQPLGKEGELLIKGPQVMRGYWNSPEETSKVLRNGWLFTGDIARMDEEGWIYIIGRKRDRIVAEGHTVWPTVVEDVLLTHPDVLQAVAVGVPDPLRCNTNVRAFVVLKKDSNLVNVERKIIEYCNARLEPFQVPESIEIVHQLPQTPMGKIDRLAIEAEIERRIQVQVEEYK